MKKIVVFSIVLIVFIVSISTAFAVPVYEGEVKPNAVMLLDAQTGEILFEENADEIIRPASTTKILTCIVALENSSLEDIVTVGPEGDWTGSGYSLLGTKNGEKIVMKDLLTGLMLRSGNDAAEAVAVYIAGSVDSFANMMNKKARELGMSRSHFVNPHGVDKDGHEVTARDMSKLALYAMQNEDFMQIVGYETYTMPKTNRNKERVIENTNIMMRSDNEAYYENVIGIKTGSTPKAFRCVVSAAQFGNQKYLCLIFGDETKNGVNRWPLAKSLFEFGANNYKTINVQSIIDSMPETTVQIANSLEQDDILLLDVINTGQELSTFEKSFAESIMSPGGVVSTVEFYSGPELSPPIKQGDTVGRITYRSASTQEMICQAELSATRDVNVQGDVSIEVTEETQRPAEQTPAPSAVDNESNSDSFVVGLGWLWLVLGTLLIGVIIFLIVSLLKGKR